MLKIWIFSQKEGKDNKIRFHFIEIKIRRGTDKNLKKSLQTASKNLRCAIRIAARMHKTMQAKERKAINNLNDAKIFYPLSITSSVKTYSHKWDITAASALQVIEIIIARYSQ